METIRTLTAEEIDCRVQSVTDKGCSLLLYKDARCDMRILDETFGCYNWQREHYECKGNLYCRVGIKKEDEWVWKSDCGTESNTEKEKGESSDSFKRACFNWGIGRELYTAPFVWISLNANEFIERNGKKSINPRIKFKVKEIGYSEKREINKLSIVDNSENMRYQLGNISQIPVEKIEKESMNDDLILAIKDINEAKTKEAVKSVWKNWECFQKNPAFIKAVSNKKNLK
jgi:hypothetical protein